jgi:hypothetical protein
MALARGGSPRAHGWCPPGHSVALPCRPSRPRRLRAWWREAGRGGRCGKGIRVLARGRQPTPISSCASLSPGCVAACHSGGVAHAPPAGPHLMCIPHLLRRVGWRISSGASAPDAPPAGRPAPRWVRIRGGGAASSPPPIAAGVPRLRLHPNGWPTPRSLGQDSGGGQPSPAVRKNGGGRLGTCCNPRGRPMPRWAKHQARSGATMLRRPRSQGRGGGSRGRLRDAARRAYERRLC